MLPFGFMLAGGGAVDSPSIRLSVVISCFIRLHGFWHAGGGAVDSPPIKLSLVSEFEVQQFADLCWSIGSLSRALPHGRRFGFRNCMGLLACSCYGYVADRADGGPHEEDA